MEPLEPEKTGTLTYHTIWRRGTAWRMIDLAAGLGFLTLAVVLRDSRIFLYGFAAVGSYFTFRGLSWLLLAHGLTINRARGRVRVWRGFLFPLFFRTRRLGQYNTVVLAKDLRKEGRTYTTYYVVQLTGDGRTDEVTAKRDYLKARGAAEQVATYAAFDLVDATPGTPVRIAAEHVGKSLRDRVREMTAADKKTEVGSLDLPPMPPRSRFTCTVDDSWLFLAIPRRRFLNVLKRPIFFGVCFGAVGALLGFGGGALAGDGHAHLLPGLWITLGFAGCGFLMHLLLFALPRAFVSYRIEAHPGGLTVRQRGLLWRRTYELSSADLRELRPADGYVQALGPDRVFRFGNDDLTRAEVDWLREALTRALAA